MNKYQTTSYGLKATVARLRKCWSRLSDEEKDELLDAVNILAMDDIKPKKEPGAVGGQSAPGGGGRQHQGKSSTKEKDRPFDDQ